MAKIREYTAQGGIEVSGAGARSIAQAGEYAGREVANINLAPAIKNIGETVIDYRDKFVVAPELNKGAALFASLQDKLTTEWNERVKNVDPNDQTIRQKFNEEVLEPEMEKFKGAFETGEGQKFADGQVNNFRLHMTQKTQADMSLRAGLALKKNLDIFSNMQTNRIMNDPSSFENAVQTMEDTIKAQVRATPGLDAKTGAAVELELKEKLRGEFAKAAIIGMAQRNPDAAEAAIASGRFNEYVNAAEAKRLLTYARTQKNLQRVDRNLDLKNEKLAREKLSEEAKDNWIKKMYPEDGSLTTVKASDIANDNSLLPEKKIALINQVNALLKPEPDAKVSRYYMQQFFTRLILPDDDPNKLTTTDEVDQAMGQGQLTREDYKFTREAIINRITPEGQRFSKVYDRFLSGIKTSISGSVAGFKNDGVGDQKFFEYQQFVDGKVAEYRRLKKNPLDLFDPKSPNYLGDEKTLAPFQTSLEDSIRNMTKRLAPPKADDRIELPQGILPIDDAVRNKYPGVQRMDRDRPDLKLKRNDLVYQKEVDKNGVKVKQWFKVDE